MAVSTPLSEVTTLATYRTRPAVVRSLFFSFLFSRRVPALACVSAKIHYVSHQNTIYLCMTQLTYEETLRTTNSTQVVSSVNTKIMKQKHNNQLFISDEMPETQWTRAGQ